MAGVSPGFVRGNCRGEGCGGFANRGKQGGMTVQCMKHRRFARVLRGGALYVARFPRGITGITGVNPGDYLLGISFIFTQILKHS